LVDFVRVIAQAALKKVGKKRAKFLAEDVLEMNVPPGFKLLAIK